MHGESEERKHVKSVDPWLEHNDWLRDHGYWAITYLGEHQVVRLKKAGMPIIDRRPDGTYITAQVPIWISLLADSLWDSTHVQDGLVGRKGPLPYDKFISEYNKMKDNPRKQIVYIWEYILRTLGRKYTVQFMTTVHAWCKIAGSEGMNEQISRQP